MRVPLALIAAWSLFLLFDPSGQVHDLIRRWLNDDALALQGLGTLAAALAFGLATWTTTRRILLVRSDSKDDAALASVIVIAVAAGLVAWWKDLENLRGTPIVLGAIAVLSGVAMLAGRFGEERKGGSKKREQTANAPETHEARSIRRFAWGLAVVPPVVLLLTTGAAMVVPALVLSAESAESDLGGEATAVAIVAPVLALILAAAATALASAVEARSKAPRRVELRHVAVALLAAGTGVAAIAWRVEVPPALGSISIVTAAIVLLMVLLGEGQRYGESHRPPAVFGAVGFVRVPVAMIVAAIFVVSSLADPGGYHDAYLSDDREPSPDGVRLPAAWEAWKLRNCVGSSGAPVPLVLIANHGGGIRAAYWTGSVLTEMLGAPPEEVTGCRTARTVDRVFALGGTSGGAVGVTSYLGQVTGGQSSNWYEEALGRQDFLSSAVSWGSLVDLPRTFVGFGGPDRARRLEEAWEREISGMDGDFFRSGPPLVLLGGTQVDTGCRLNVSRVRLTMRAAKPPPTACNAVPRRSASTNMTDLGAERPVVHHVPDAAMTSDVLDHLCRDGGSLHRSTAALLSARFPYVSPSGRLPVCGTEDHTAVVDGGYAENSGGQGLLDLWARLEPLVQAHNERAAGALVVPIFVHVDNHYAEAARAAPRGRTEELLVPPSTAGRPDKLDDLGIEQLANATFSTDLPGRPGTVCKIGDGPAQRFVRIAPPDSPGVPAPLAWTLSEMATDELDGQRRAAFALEPAKALTEVLRDTAQLGSRCPPRESARRG